MFSTTLDRLKKARWEEILLAAVALFFAVRYGGAFFLMLLSSDYLLSVHFFRDVISHGNSPHDWEWCSTPYTFPDLACVFGLNGILGDSVVSLQAYTSLLFLGFYAVVLLIYRECGGRHFSAFCGLLLLLLIGIATNFGLSKGFRVIEFLAPVNHSGAWLSALACLYFLLRFLQRNPTSSLVLLGTVLILNGISDASALLVFSLPCSVALALSASWYRERARPLLFLAASIFGTALLAYFLCPHLFPASIVRDGYTRPQLAAIVPTLRIILHLLRPTHNQLFVLFFTLNAFFVLGVGAYLAGFFPGRARRLPLPLFLLLTFTAAMILINWAAIVATGNLTLSPVNRFGDFRYYAMTIVAPLFLLTGCVAQALPWNRLATGLLAVLVSALAADLAVFHLPQPSSYYEEARRLDPLLHKIMDDEGIRYGLADYWHAIPITYLSNDSVILRQIFAGGTYLSGSSNLKWYAGDTPGQPRDFNLVLMKDFDPQAIQKRYGPPTKTVFLGEYGEAWLYLGDDAIQYSASMQDLLPKRRISGATVTWKPGDLFSQTGTIESGSIIAAEGRDKAGYLLFGPYAHPQGGSYRIDLAYAYPIPPAAGKEADIDVVTDNIPPHFSPLKTLAQGKLTPGGTFSRTLSIPDGLRVQVRIFYPGSGTLRVDSLQITHVTP